MKSTWLPSSPVSPLLLTLFMLKLLQVQSNPESGGTDAQALLVEPNFYALSFLFWRLCVDAKQWHVAQADNPFFGLQEAPFLFILIFLVVFRRGFIIQWYTSKRDRNSCLSSPWCL